MKQQFRNLSRFHIQIPGWAEEKRIYKDKGRGDWHKKGRSGREEGRAEAKVRSKGRRARRKDAFVMSKIIHKESFSFSYPRCQRFHGLSEEYDIGTKATAYLSALMTYKYLSGQSYQCKLLLSKSFPLVSRCQRSPACNWLCFTCYRLYGYLCKRQETTSCLFCVCIATLRCIRETNISLMLRIHKTNK